jgi:mycothiol synthase
MRPLITHRPYAGDPDYQRIRTFLQSIFALGGPCPLITIGDLDYWRFQNPDPAGCIQSCGLWQDSNDTVIGFAWPGIELDGTGIIDLSVHPSYTELLAPMLLWSEAWLQQAMPSTTACLDVTTSALEHGAELTAVLSARGWTRTDNYHQYRAQSLVAPIPDRVLPAGYTIRHVEGRDDIAPFTALNNLARPGPALTVATYGAMMDAPTYCRELNLIVCAPDATFAAFCILWYDDVNRAGLFEPVGCHPAHQRKGLATALMREGLRRLQQRGATHALVATSRRNQAANALYESLGFRATAQKWYWQKTLYP